MGRNLRGPVLGLRRILDHLLEDHVHKEKQWLGFHNENDAFLVWIIIKMLVDSHFHNQRISCFPVDSATVMNVMPFPFKTKKTAEFI